MCRSYNLWMECLSCCAVLLGLSSLLLVYVYVVPQSIRQAESTFVYTLFNAVNKVYTNGDSACLLDCGSKIVVSSPFI